MCSHYGCGRDYTHSRTEMARSSADLRVRELELGRRSITRADHSIDAGDCRSCDGLVVRRWAEVVSYFLVQKGKGGYSPILYREDKELFF